MTQTIKILIVDDEKPSRRELSYLLKTYAFSSEIKEADSFDSGLKLVSGFCPDIVFIDIEMGQKSGFDLAVELRKMQPSPIIVFATAFEQFALDSYRHDACDYILKPFSESRLNMTISRAMQRLNGKQANTDLERFSVAKEGGRVMVEIGDILFITRDNRKTLIRTINKEYYCNKAIKEYEWMLKPNGILRSHTSYLVNIYYVEEIQEWFNGAYKLKLRGYDKTIPLSRGYVGNFKI